MEINPISILIGILSVYTTKAKVTLINMERALYRACPSPSCNKKVVDQNNCRYRCEKCQREFPNFKWCLMLAINITDASNETKWVTCFQEAAETRVLRLSDPRDLLGRSADELGLLKDSDSTQFQKVFEDATLKWFVFRMCVKKRRKEETYNYQTRLKTTVLEVLNGRK